MTMMAPQINVESLYVKNQSTMNDWRYSEEALQIRAECFRSLSHYLNDHCRAVFEFCDLWIKQGNRDCKNIDMHFQIYLNELN